MRVHVLQVSTVPMAESFFEATRMTSAMRAALRRTHLPVFGFVVEHNDGLIVLDSGWHHGVSDLPMVKRLLRLTGKTWHMAPDEEIGPRMRAAGLRPEDVRLVLPTHLDADHAGGIGHFPNATIVVNRPEYDYVTKTRIGRARGQSAFWPEWFAPSFYDLQPEPYGPFPSSYTVADGIRVVPTPGHSPAHVSPVFDSDGKKVLFAGDHIIRASWITNDGIRVSAALHAYKKLARETNDRLAAFVKEFPTVVLPSHDTDAAANASAL